MDKKYTKEEIFDFIAKILTEEFDIKSDLITHKVNLYTDLDLDSIDAVDMAVRLQQFTDKRISPEEFKQIRTMDDIVETVYKLL